MPAHPLPIDAMQAREPIQLSPQILVLPALPTKRHGLDQELRVRMEYDGLAGRQIFQRFDRGHYFHAIIGGVGTMSRTFPSCFSVLDDDIGPATRTGIPQTTAVGIDLNLS